MGVNSDLRMFHVFKVLHVHVQTLLEFVRPSQVSGNPRQVRVQRKLSLFRKFLFNEKICYSRYFTVCHLWSSIIIF